MTDSLCGTWDMVSNDNFEGVMVEIGISLWLRKIAVLLKHRKVMEQHGELFIMKTITTFRSYAFSFKVDQEFEEFTKGLDNRHVKSKVTLEGNKLVCHQIGEIKQRGWAHWIEEDKLHVEIYCGDQVCKQVFMKNVNK